MGDWDVVSQKPVSSPDPWSVKSQTPVGSAQATPAWTRPASMEDLSVPGRDAIRDPLGNMTTDPTGLVGQVKGVANLPGDIQQHRDLVEAMGQMGFPQEQIAEERKNNPLFNALFAAAIPLAAKGVGAGAAVAAPEVSRLMKDTTSANLPSLARDPADAAARLKERASGVVNKAFDKSVAGGETTALRAIDQISAARQAGQPLTVSDVGGRPVRRLAGAIYRSGGEPAALMERFYKGRGSELTLDHLNTVAGQRIEKAIGEHIATGSYKEATKNLISERSARARPLWEEATAGGSLAPLEKQFEAGFSEASKAEQEAVKKLSQIRNELTQAAARQSQAGNVYSASGANRDARLANQKVKAAQAELTEARKASDAARERLHKAQLDGSANAPGAIWSPRLQQFLDLPDWQKGIRRGLHMERRDAVTERRPFNPSEYAIVGGTIDDPVIGQVPTMKLLQIAKEGISAQIDDMRDPLTGGLSKAGRSLWLNLKAFEEEGYRLNPSWKVANDAWSGDTSSIRALQLGKKIFTIPMEDLQQDFAAMSKNDKELFRLSAASKAVEDLRKTPLSADPSKRVINSPDELMRLRVLFDNPNDFNKFVENIYRERTMFETPTDVMRGSQTAERARADAGTALDAAHGIGRLASGHVLSAVSPLIRASRGLGLFENPRLNLEVAKILIDPNVAMVASPGAGLVSDPASIMRRAASP